MTVAPLAFEKPAATWKFAGAGRRPPTLTAPIFKLEKVCRSYRKKRRGTSVIASAAIPRPGVASLRVTEFGGTVMAEVNLTKASGEAPRRAPPNEVAPAEATPVVQDNRASSSVREGTMSVTPSPPSDAAFGETATLSVRIPFSQVIWLLRPMNVGEARRPRPTPCTATTCSNLRMVRKPPIRRPINRGAIPTSRRR
jgi:hypothetical protein